MKLVDILARELEEWPEDSVVAVQDADGEVKFSDQPTAYLDAPGCVWIRRGYGGDESFKEKSGVPDDYRTSIVTRAQWQAAVEALKSPSLHIQQIGRITRQQETIDWSKAPGGATHAAFTGGVDGHHVWYKIGDHGFRYVYSDDLARGGGFKKGVGGPSHGPLINRPLPSESWNGEGLPPVGAVCEYMWNYRREGSEYLTARVLAHDGRWAIVRVIGGEHDRLLRESNGGDCGGHPIFRPIRTPEQIAAEEREKAVREMLKLMPNEDPDRSYCELLCEALYDAGYRKQVQP